MLHLNAFVVLNLYLDKLRISHWIVARHIKTISEPLKGRVTLQVGGKQIDAQVREDALLGRRYASLNTAKRKLDICLMAEIPKTDSALREMYSAVSGAASDA